MPRSALPAKQRREMIMDVAYELFTTKGYQNTTIEDILRGADIAKGTLYHHFRSKEQVLEGIIDRTVQQITEHAQLAAASAPNPVEGLLGVIGSARVAGEHDAMVAQFHAPGNSEPHLMSLVRTVNALAPILAGVVEEGVAAGMFTCAHPLEYSELLLTSGFILTDSGVFPATPEDTERRLAGAIAAAEALFGCVPGTLSPLMTSGRP